MGRCARVTLFTLGAFVALAGCNSLTGASALEPVSEEPIPAPPHDSGTLLGSDGGGGTVDAGSDAAPTDSGATDADAADAPIDAAPCTPVAVGPRYGAAADGAVWSNDPGILVPGDGQYTHSNGGGEPIVVTDFGFSLPSTATIKGIKVDIARTAAAPNSVFDEAITLPKGAAKSNGAWPVGPLAGPYVTATYGGPTDTWGTSWSAAEINAASFSVSLDITSGGDGHADSLGVTVYYCP